MADKKVVERDIQALIEAAQRVQDHFSEAGYALDKNATSAMDAIIWEVARQFDVSKFQLTGPSKKSQFATPRAVAMHVMRGKLSMSLKEIGGYFGRDHTTVLSADRRISAKRLEDPYLEYQVGQVERAVEHIIGPGS